MGFLSTLTLIFIILKLVGVIFWSWWLVLLPLYFDIALVLAAMWFGLSFAVVVMAILSLLGIRRRRRRAISTIRPMSR